MNDKNNAVDLLEKAKDILLLRSQQPKKTGEDFNIFTVLQLNEMEHCRLLYELLNPKGNHGMGDCFLRSFFELVLQKPYPTEDVSVYLEYAFLNGRIDLLIAGRGCCYPIEVKIYADDQQAQLARYDEFAATKAKEHQVYYLTLSGYEPSEQSKGCADVVCLSFAEEIRKWLVRCGELAWWQSILAETIRQYIKLLDELTGNIQDDIYMQKIRDEIEKSQANYESAAVIADSLLVVKAEMMKRVFAEIEKHMEGKLEQLSTDYQNSAVKYYQANRMSYPAIAYRLAENEGKIATLGFEVGWSLYWGICFYDKNKHIERPKDGLAELLSAMFPDTNWQNIKPDSSSWWLWWEYLPKEVDMQLNFKECTGIYPQLYDKNWFNIIMQQIFDQIDEHLEHIKKTGLYE